MRVCGKKKKKKRWMARARKSLLAGLNRLPDLESVARPSGLDQLSGSSK